jgi:hypothetical protein
LVRKSGALGRLTRKREEFYPQLDREQLRICGRCREIVFPCLDQTPGLLGELPLACHYCGGREQLKPLNQDSQANHDKEGRR